jgi:multiple sugar transport system substrate-binding protein
LKDILPQALSTCYYNDSLYAIPFFIDVGVMYYRKDLIEKLDNSDDIIVKLHSGILWEDLFELHNKRQSGNYTYVFQGDAYEGLICNFMEMLGNKAETIYENDNFNVNTPFTIAATQKLFDLIHKYKISPFEITGFDEGKSFEYALENNVPFFRGWPTTYKYSNLVSKTTRKLNLLEEVPLPRNSENQSSSVIGGWNFVLSRYSSVKEDAITFIKFILSKEMQELNYSSGSYLPIINSFYNDSYSLLKYPKLAKFKNLIENGLHRPSVDNYTKFSDILSSNLNSALRKERTVEQALWTAQSQIDSSLNYNLKF